MENHPDPEIHLIEPEIRWYETPFFSRLILILLPPVGLWLLWRSAQHTRRAKWLGSVFAVLWMLPYLVLGILGLQSVGLVALEFRGGFGPSLVGHKTEPNYALLEANRQQQASPPTHSAASDLRHRRPYWTDFRGPRRDGIYTEEPLLKEWPADGPRLLWRQPCGGGYASFVVAEGLAFTIEQRWDKEVVAAYDLETGREVWTDGYAALFSEWMGGDGPRATPTYHDGFVFSLGATGELRCLGAATGTLMWRRNVLEDTGAGNLRYGLACSPIVWGKTVIVLSGEGAKGQTVVAYDYLNGHRAWAALDDAGAYTSPIRAELAGREQLVLVTASRVLGFDPERQTVLWEFPWKVQYDNAICVPVLAGTNSFMLSAGYGTGALLLNILQTTGQFSATPVWRNRNMKNKFNASVFHRGHFYGLDEGVLACVNAETGERLWRDGHYGYGQVLLAGDQLIVLCGDGRIALVDANPGGFRERAVRSALQGKSWNEPALAHGRIILRNSAEMACFDLRPIGSVKH